MSVRCRGGDANGFTRPLTAWGGQGQGARQGRVVISIQCQYGWTSDVGPEPPSTRTGTGRARRVSSKMDSKDGLTRKALMALGPSDASDTTSAFSIDKNELQAWQDRCAVVEAALAAANEVLHRELPGWQERCAAMEAALGAANAELQRELPKWERRCAVTEGALAAANDRLADEIPRWRDRCELAEAALASLYESRKGQFVFFTDTDAFLRFASNFTPERAIGLSKRRIGTATDGGYIMLDSVASPSLALSFGVGDNTSWDCQMADLGATVHQYDPTVQAPLGQPSRVVFHPKRIVDVADGSGVTLEEALSVLEGSDIELPAVLKIDIEGNEWAVLDSVPDSVLQRFDQIICEYHDFGEAVDPDWFERACRVAAKLNHFFQVVHVHGNNGEPVVVIGGVPFPSVLEVTHVNRSRYGFQPTDERFPTRLDCPNHPGRPDLWLGSFSFEPGT